MRLFLIRHGETAWALTGQHTSRTDLPLTEHGRARAATLPARLAQYYFRPGAEQPAPARARDRGAGRVPAPGNLRGLARVRLRRIRGPDQAANSGARAGLEYFPRRLPRRRDAGAGRGARAERRGPRARDGGRHAGVHARAPRAHPCRLAGSASRRLSARNSPSTPRRSISSATMVTGRIFRCGMKARRVDSPPRAQRA